MLFMWLLISTQFSLTIVMLFFVRYAVHKILSSAVNIIFFKCFLWPQVFAIIRDIDNPQLFAVEFVRGATKKFMSTDRSVK